jgi:hypothetical protein
MFDTVTDTPDNPENPRIAHAALTGSLLGSLPGSARITAGRRPVARYAGTASEAKIAVHTRMWTTSYQVWMARWELVHSLGTVLWRGTDIPDSSAA